MKTPFKIVALLSMALALQACTQIDTGNVGVERAFGKVSMNEVGQGVYMTVLDSVEEVTTKEVAIQMNDLTPKSLDNLTMKEVDVDVYYKVNPSKAADLYVKYQGDVVQHRDLVQGGTSDYVVASGRVFREAREAIYTAVSAFNSNTIHTQRAELAENIRNNLQRALNVSDPGAFTVTSINVRSVRPDPAIETAIQRQAAMTAEISRRDQAIKLAVKEAERLKVEAEGQAIANNILNSSLTGQLVQLQLAEIRRQTVVGAAGKGNTVIVDAEAVPMIGR